MERSAASATDDANAFAVLVRRVLDLVCEEQGAIGHTLAIRLRDLASKNVIPGPLADIANNARTFGNVGAHADLGDLKQDEAALADDLRTAVLEGRRAERVRAPI